MRVYTCIVVGIRVITKKEEDVRLSLSHVGDKEDLHLVEECLEKMCKSKDIKRLDIFLVGGTEDDFSQKSYECINECIKKTITVFSKKFPINLCDLAKKACCKTFVKVKKDDFRHIGTTGIEITGFNKNGNFYVILNYEMYGTKNAKNR